jgi:glycosyltransferase involved in cell wall biosynthesis
MRIGVNALYLIPGGVGGTEIYLRALLDALAEIDGENEYFLFTNRETGAALGPKAANFRVVEQTVRATSRPARIVWEQIALPMEVSRMAIDVLLNPGFTAPLLCGCPQVTVFHDLQHKRHPEYFRWWDLPFWRFFLWGAARVSRRIVAVSDATAADLQRYYGVAEKVRVVPHGVAPWRRAPEPKGSYILTVSTLHPHKNLDGLLRAFAEFRKTHLDFRLVVCGMHGFVSGPLHDLRERLGLADAVEFPGWIPRDDLLDLFARAAAFIYPSRFEGFGMPVLEALAAGIPTACSDIEPLRSIAGGAAILFDPSDVAAMARAMEQLLTEDGSRGPARAAEFTWRATAEGTLNVLREAFLSQDTGGRR